MMYMNEPPVRVFRSTDRHGGPGEQLQADLAHIEYVTKLGELAAAVSNQPIKAAMTTRRSEDPS